MSVMGIIAVFIFGALLGGVHGEVLDRAFWYWKSIDAAIGARIEAKVRHGAAPEPAQGMGQGAGGLGASVQKGDQDGRAGRIGDQGGGDGDVGVHGSSSKATGSLAPCAAGRFTPR